MPFEGAVKEPTCQGPWGRPTGKSLLEKPRENATGQVAPGTLVLLAEGTSISTLFSKLKRQDANSPNASMSIRLENSKCMMMLKHCQQGPATHNIGFCSSASLKAANQSPTVGTAGAQTHAREAAKPLGSTFHGLSVTAHAIAQLWEDGPSGHRNIHKGAVANGMPNGPCTSLALLLASGQAAGRPLWHWHSCAHWKAARKRS
jgi:hypothetical protein